MRKIMAFRSRGVLDSPPGEVLERVLTNRR